MRQKLNSLLLLLLWTPSDFRFHTKSWRHNKQTRYEQNLLASHFVHACHVSYIPALDSFQIFTISIAHVLNFWDFTPSNVVD